MVIIALVGRPPDITGLKWYSMIKYMDKNILECVASEYKYVFRNNREQHHDLHGFADSRLALVRRSMIARRTQARLREKRRRNRTVALSPEDDRRSSFISTFLDTKQLQDQSCQVPSQHSTLSNKTNVSWTCPSLLRDITSLE